jgi:4-amino-4-deoxy-L-arabinose transferase-like glycosyltransferase
VAAAKRNKPIIFLYISQWWVSPTLPVAPKMQNALKNPWFKVILISALVLIMFFKIFWNLGAAPLQRWDEQGNVDVVQTTMQSGNWLILKCKDKCSDCLPREQAVPFLEKPPLWYWLTMCSVKAFGESNTVYRLVPALSGFLLLMLLYFLSSTWFGFPAGMATIVTLLTTRHLFMTGDTCTTHSLRTADLDSLQLLLIMLSIFFFWRAQQHVNFTSRRLKTETAYLALAIFTSVLAYFTKGPMGFLPVIIFILYLVINAPVAIGKDGMARRPLSKELKLFAKNSAAQIAKIPLLLLAIMTVVIVPWYIYQYYHNGRAFIDDHILYHLVQRAAEPLEGHHGTWRFYFNIFINMKIFLMGIPACIGLLTIATGAFDRLKSTANGERLRLHWWEDFRLFSIVAGFVLSFAVITAVQTKLMWYILYVYPFAALIVGAFTRDLVALYQKKIRGNHS